MASESRGVHRNSFKKKKITPIYIHWRLLRVFAGQTRDLSIICWWVTYFSRGHNYVSDKPHSIWLYEKWSWGRAPRSTHPHTLVPWKMGYVDNIFLVKFFSSQLCKSWSLSLVQIFANVPWSFLFSTDENSPANVGNYLRKNTFLFLNYQMLLCPKYLLQLLQK